MVTTPVTLLIVDDDAALSALLAAAAVARGISPVSVTSLDDTERILRERGFGAAIVDLGLGADSGFDAIRRIKQHDPDIEIVVMSATDSLAPAIQSYDMAAFAFVQKPFELDHLFATLDRALERRRINLHNRRLLWEFQTINEIADGVGQSLELDDILTGALQRVVRALSAVGGSIRLKDPVTGVYELQATVGSPLLQRMWMDLGLRNLRPSDRVIQTRTAVMIEDLRALAPGDLPADLLVRSALSVPMLAGGELLGTLTVGSDEPHRFDAADQRLLATIAGQISIAVQNARLHDFVRRGKREWEQTFDAIGDPIAVFDDRGGLLRANTAVAAHLGRDVTQLRGATCREVGFCGGAPDCTVAKALAGEASRAEVSTDDGRIFSVTTFPVAAGAAQGPSVVQVAKNVTEEIRVARRLRQVSEELAIANAHSTAALERLKSTQAQLLQAEKLSAIGQLVAGVAHELNNPLTSVIGYAQLLEEEVLHATETDGSSRAQMASDLHRIAAESERAARIVRNLLAFARRQSASREPQDVADLFGRVMSLRSYEMRLNNIELQTAFDPHLPPVVADAGQLQQALLNLVLNAEQAMRHRPARRLRVGARHDEAAGAVELFISDTGHGIEEANLSRIFDPFFTTRDVGEGTGLGLSICYGIVRDHGGQILVESKVGVGTTFSLLLPARVDAVPHAAPVLVAHQEQGERDYLAAMLAGWGCVVVTAATAADALAVCRVRDVQAIVAGIGVIASDLGAWRAWRAAQAHPAPMVLVSREADDGEAERFARSEACAALAPPFQLRAVRAAVRAASRECV